MKLFYSSFPLIFLTFLASFADVEMSITFTKTDYYRGQLKWKNRQDKYVWNNDLLNIVAVGYLHNSTPLDPMASVGLRCFLTLGKDADGLTQYRFLYPRSDKISLLPGEDAIYSSTSPIDVILQSLGTNCPYPRYPHIVLRESPWYGLKFTNTNKYAPPLYSDAIDASTGAVIGQTDYYKPEAWFARDNAPFFVDTNHHPTQLWLGTPHILASSKVEDGKNPSDYYTGQFSESIGATGDGVGHGSYITPNSPTGAGVNYAHRKGAGPGGLMLAMAVAWGQEIFGIDMRVPISQGCKETFLCVYNDNSHPYFPVWQYQGTQVNVDPYQITDAIRMGIAYQTMPDYYDHAAVYVKNFPTVSNKMKTNIVNATVTFYLTTTANFYLYLSASRAHRLDEFLTQASDPFSHFRIMAYAYNQGPNPPNMTIPDMRYGANRAGYLASKNLSNSFNMVGGYGYCPKVIDLSKRMGKCPDVYDWGITWGDVEDFADDLRSSHYVNGIPSNTVWTEMLADLRTAFDKMKGKAPTTGLSSDKISYRYNWLTMIRIMKSYLPRPATYMGKGATFNSNRAPFMGAYVPSFAFNPNGDVDQESKPATPDTNYAPEIYWITPRYPLPSLQQAFPVIDNNIFNHIPIEITADILDDGVGKGKLTARYCVSLGDPAKGGHSLWLDGEKTGGAPKNPVAVEWVVMKDIGPSKYPTGGRRFQAFFNASAIKNETRRFYIEASDNCGYRTISWVDVYIKDSGLKLLEINAAPPDGTIFAKDTTVTLSTIPSDPAVRIYYTIDGSAPDTTNSAQLYSAPFTISADTTIVRGIAIGPGYAPDTGTWRYFKGILQTAKIIADPPSGTTFYIDTTVALSTQPAGLTIFYTTDGSNPTVFSTKYTSPFLIFNDTVFVKAIACAQGFDTARATFVYYKKAQEPATLIAIPDSGTHFDDTLSVTLQSNADTILYGLDGSAPSVFYSAPIQITVLSKDTFIIKAAAFDRKHSRKAGTFIYYRNQKEQATLLAMPFSGTHFGDTLSVRLSSSADTILYGLNGSLPATVYSAPIQITAGSKDTFIIKGAAYDNKHKRKDSTFFYYRDRLPKVIAIPPSTTFTDSISVTLTIAWPAAKIYYTLDGSYPDTTSTATKLYVTTPVIINKTTTLIARAFASNAVASDTTMERYTQIFQIAHAVYQDINGDGRIDFSKCLFKYQPPDLPEEVQLTDPLSTVIASIQKSFLSWENNNPSSLTMNIIINPAFNYSGSTTFTDGYFGKITKGLFVTDSFIIKDSVAPVIHAATYCPGEIINESTLERAPDSLQVTFTEWVNDIAVEKPFLLEHPNNQTYSLTLSQVRRTGTMIVFLVKKNSPETPRKGDSIWIATDAKISDANGAIQSVKENRHVELKIKKKPYRLTVLALSPRNPETDTIPSLLAPPFRYGLVTVADFHMDLQEDADRLDCAVMLVDPLGNDLGRSIGISDKTDNLQSAVIKGSRTKIVIYWNGRNMQGRMAGPGTYAALIKITDYDGNTIIARPMLGVEK